MPQIYMSHVKKWQMKINLVNELSVMKINICYILAEQVNDIKNFRLGAGNGFSVLDMAPIVDTLACQ